MPRTIQTKNWRQNLFNLSAVCATFVAITACVWQADKDVAPGSTENSAPNQSSENSNDNPPDSTKNKFIKDKNSDKGDFIVEHIEIKNSRYAKFDQKTKNEKFLERAADKLNHNLMLPYDIHLRTKECGEVNALYETSDHSISVCFELMEHYFKLFKSTGKTEEAAYEKMFDAVRFAFLHELGHALIDAYDLPITGNEEDAADRCSSYICLTQLGDEGVRSVLAAADGFAIESKNVSPKEEDFADEHLLGEQRFYNTLCMIYGSDNLKYDYLVKENYLPKERAARCSIEYERSVKSWNNLFEPWRKE